MSAQIFRSPDSPGGTPGVAVLRRTGNNGGNGETIGSDGAHAQREIDLGVGA